MRPSKAPPAAAASADGADSAPSTSGAFVSSGTAFRYSDITALDEAWAFLVQLTVAGGSGAIARTAVAPLERVKLLLQVQHLANSNGGGSRGAAAARPPYQGMLDALRRIPQEQGGWRALYRGNGANVLRLLPEVGFFKFVVHDQFRIMFAPADGSGHLGQLERTAAGAATGILKTLALHPLDTARVRISTDVTPPGMPRRYSGIVQCLAATYWAEGLRGWYKGMGAAMLGIVPYLSVSFSTYDYLKSLLPTDPASQAAWYFPLLKMGCGSLAAAAAQTVAYPLDTVRRTMQVSGAEGYDSAPGRQRGWLTCVRQLMRHGGVAAFYRGCATNCARTVPGAAVQFVAYDAVKVCIMAIDPTTGVTSPL